MNQRTTRPLLSIIAIAMLLNGSEPVTAAAPVVAAGETRTYEILIDGAKSGQSTLTITQDSDGNEIASTDAKLTVVWTVFTYVYEFNGQERWHQGRLEQLTSRAVDGGRPLALTATRMGRGLSVSKSGGPPSSAPDVQLTTNYWRQPLGVAIGSPLAILDADNGKIYEAKIESIGHEELSVAGRLLPCTSYRLKGAVEVKLWFDAAGYLVRQVGTEDGHRTELRLVSIGRPAGALAGMSH
jgi:uncharacterized protein DUF6134